MSDDRPIVFDDDNPEWTDEDFARARAGAEVLPPEFVAALKRARGRPPGSTSSQKQRVTLRLDRDAIDRLKASGPGWQTRINEAVRKAAGL
jgi:uncharacterized protein (DUF4415 family)